MADLRAAVRVTGRVQGVNFRYATYRQALSLGVSGWVKNQPDGSVEACLEGNEAAVRQLIEWLRQGPPSARVDEVAVEEMSGRGEFDSFEIVR